MQSRILLLLYITVILIPGGANAEDRHESPDLIHGVPSDQSVDTATRSDVVTRLLHTPLHFVANRGQMDEDVLYYARSDGATVY